MIDWDSDERLRMVADALLTAKSHPESTKTYVEIAKELSQIFPEYSFSEEKVRHYWRRNRNNKRKLKPQDGRINIQELRDIKQYKFPTEEVRIVCISDIHGLDYHNKYEIFLETVNFIEENENTYAIILGDMINFATRTSKSSPYTSRGPEEEILLVKEDLQPIKDKILGGVGGNHGKDRGLRSDGIDPEYILFRDLGIEDIYFGNIGIIRTDLNDLSYFLVFAHGARGMSARKRTTRLVNPEEVQGIYPNADIYVTGHTHLFGYFTDSVRLINPIENKIVEKEQHLVSSGATQGYEGSYVEAKLLKPVSIGLAHIILKNKLKPFGGKEVDVLFR